MTPFLTRALVVLLATLALCPVAFWIFERSVNPEVDGLADASFWMWRTLIEQASPSRVSTAGGWVVYHLVLVIGVGLVAAGTGAVVSMLLDRYLRRAAGMGSTRLSGHVLICGWSTKARHVVDELLAAADRPVVVLADLDSPPLHDGRVVFVRGDPAHREDLERAGLSRAHTAIVLADDTFGARNAREIDGKTLLSALAIEATYPRCYTCVEVLAVEDVEHFAQAGADELIVSGEVTSLLLASAATDHGLSRALSDLLTHDHRRGPHDLVEVPVDASMIGRSMLDVLADLKRERGWTVIAVIGGDEAIEVNPSAERTLAAGERILAISDAASAGRSKVKTPA